MNDKLCLAYIPGNDAPNGSLDATLKRLDFKKLTHICVAFSRIEEKNGVWLPVVSGEIGRGIEKIKTAVKAEGAGTKILLSVGGAGADGFCRASRSDASRKAFSNELVRLIDEFQLDGADIDWEFPGESLFGTACCKACKKDFILLMEEIRQRLGSRLLTAAVGSNRYFGIDVKRLGRAADYVFVMTYDLGVTHSNAVLSKMFVTMWRLLGIPAKKLCIGVPIYGRNVKRLEESISFRRAAEGRISHLFCQSFSDIDGAKWCFDTEKDVLRKARWARKRKLGGVFCWEISSDKNNLMLSAMYNGINGKE